MSRVKRKKHGSKPSTLLAAEKEDSALKIQETEVKNQEMGGKGVKCLLDLGKGMRVSKAVYQSKRQQ